MTMSNNTVITFDGTTAKRENCKFIKGQFYIKGKQCFYLKDKWVRINSKYIVIDQETGKFYHVDEAFDLIEGIVSFKEGEPIRGKFSPNVFNNVDIAHNDNSREVCINVDIIPKDLYTEFNSAYISNKELAINKSAFKYITSKIKSTNIKYRDLPFNYNSDHTLKFFEVTKNNKYFKDLVTQGEYLKHSYGIEYETYSGRIPEYNIFRYGLMPLRDGSLAHDGIQPFEYATIPLVGKEVLPITKKHCEMLQQHCDLNASNASLHIHQGAHTMTMEYLVAYYLTVLCIQDEIYKMFPSYVRNSASYKGKDYCKPLPSITELERLYMENWGASSDYKKASKLSQLYTLIYGYFVEENINGSNSLNLKSSHRKDSENRHKWYINSRYHLTNFVSMLCSDKRTLEWRLHTPTFNYDKISNFIKILESISSWVDLNKKSILDSTVDISLDTILRETNNIIDYSLLTKYVAYRKENFTGFSSNSDGRIINNEVDTDHKFSNKLLV